VVKPEVAEVKAVDKHWAAAAMVKAEEAAAAKVKQVVVEVKRSWWRSLWLCGMVAVEK
jgi:hypothetical protein